MIWGRSISCRSRVVWSWGRVIGSGSRVVGGGSMLSVLQERFVLTGGTLVLDISVVLLVLVYVVVHDLGTAVRKLNPVLSFHLIAVPLFGPGVHVRVAVRIVIVHGVLELVVLGGLLMVGSGVVGGLWGGVVRGRSRVVGGRSWVVWVRCIGACCHQKDG